MNRRALENTIPALRLACEHADGVEFDVSEGPKGPRAENVRRTTT